MLVPFFKIRNAKPSDLKLLIKLGRQTQLETFLKDNKPEVMQAYLDENFNELVIKNELADGNSSYFISELDAQPIGYIKIRTDNIKENELAGKNAIELQRIYIVSSEKGKGFGKKQLDFAESFAKKEGYSIIWLGVWEKNMHAMKFYEKNGYFIFGAHQFIFGGEDQTDFMMKKYL